MEVYKILILSIVGILAGFLNTIAGGGSVITLSVMILFGMPSAIANGTNRIALLAQNTSAVMNFKSKGYFDWKINLAFGIPAVVGSIIGSNIAVSMSDEVFNRLLIGIMVIILLQMIIQPRKKISVEAEHLSPQKMIVGMIVFFCIGIYGGIIQAGVGIVIISLMTMITGFSLTKINAVKVFVIGLYTISALSVFIMNGKIDFIIGICVALGNALGAFLGSNFAVAKGDRWVRWIIIVMILGIIIKLIVTR